MKKQSQFVSMWPQIYRKLKNPPPGINLGNFPSSLPPIDRIKIDSARLEHEPQAVGYVSTEDVDNNGTLDVIHIASPRLEEAMREAGASLEDFRDLEQLSNEELIRVLTPFVELLSHEIGHLNDFTPGQDNPFPGGEGVADSAARSAVQQISVGTTNIKNKLDKTGSFTMSIKTLKILADLATDLDKKGSTEIADHVEKMMKKISQEDWLGRDSFPPRVIEDVSPLDMSQKAVEVKPRATPGNIRPAGDNYTYNFNADQTFSIATIPEGKEESLIGRIIGPGDGGYDLLKAEAIRMGLMSAPDLEREPVAKPATTGRAWELAKKLNLAAVPSPEQARYMAKSDEGRFRDMMKKLSDEMVDSAYSGMFGGGASAGVFEGAVRPLAQSGLTGAGARAAWRNIEIVAPSSIGAEELERFRQKIGGFDSAMAIWERAQNLKRLAMELSDGNLAEDGVANPEEGDEAVEASNILEDKVQKIASLKEDFHKIFWFNTNRPFNRSNTKFKR